MNQDKSLLAQLENNEAILLMYLAGELPEQDRLEVQHLLEHDRHLRAELERLQAAIASTDRRLNDTDSISDVDVERTIRRTISAMHQQQAAPSRRSAQPQPQPSVRRMPAWLYPIAAAAVLLITISVYLSNIEPGKRPPVRDSQIATELPEAIGLPSSSGINPLEADHKADELIASLDDTDELFAAADTSEGLTDAAVRLDELRHPSAQTDATMGLE